MRARTTKCEIGERVREIADVLGKKAHVSGKMGIRQYAADVAGVSVNQLLRYFSCQSDPPFLPIARMAKEAGYSMEWVFSGKGQKFAYPDQFPGDLIRDCILAVEQSLLSSKRTILPKKKALLIMSLLEIYRNSEKKIETDSVTELIRSISRTARHK